jgi:hypothetical protein
MARSNRPATANRIAADQNGPISRSAIRTPIALAPAKTTNTRNAPRITQSRRGAGEDID